MPAVFRGRPQRRPGRCHARPHGAPIWTSRRERCSNWTRGRWPCRPATTKKETTDEDTRRVARDRCAATPRPGRGGLALEGRQRHALLLEPGRGRAARRHAGQDPPDRGSREAPRPLRPRHGRWRGDEGPRVASGGSAPAPEAAPDIHREAAPLRLLREQSPLLRWLVAPGRHHRDRQLPSLPARPGGMAQRGTRSSRASPERDRLAAGGSHVCGEAGTGAGASGDRGERRGLNRRRGRIFEARARRGLESSAVRETSDGPDLDLKSRRNVQDPFPLYAWLRDNEPVHWSDSLDAWVVTRYEDVVEIFDRPETFSSDRFRKIDERYTSQRPAVRAVAEVLGHWLVFRDPPDHDRLRGLLQSSFTPRQLESSRDRIQRTVDALLDRVAARGAMDFIRELAFPLPATVIAGLMGAPEADLQAIKTWSDRLAAYLGGAVDERDNFAEASAGVAGLADYFRALLRERERRPRDDLMSLMLRAEHAGDHLTRDEVVANCILLLFAGHETTTNLLGNGLFHLLRHPAEAALLRADPSLLHGAVEELLRYDGPVPATVKVATEDVPWRGRTIRRGDMVVPFLASANRDPRQFPDPDTLDVRRQPERHLAFAWGIHFCLGAWLARLEARVVLDTVFRRLPELALAPGEPRWKPMIFLRGLESLPLVWEST